MTTRGAGFYFANLGADIVRCIHAADDAAHYQSALERARRTLQMLRAAERPEAYEEGLLLTRALEHARASGQLGALEVKVNHLIARIAMRV